MNTRTITDTTRETIHELYPALRRFAAVTAPWDLEPDDILHGALARVLRSKSLADVDNLGAYLRRAIVNEVRDQLRRRASQRTALARIRPSVDATTESYPSDVSDLMLLSPRERAVIYLHDIEGRPFEEVAAMVGLRSAAARATASRARRRLKAKITEEST